MSEKYRALLNVSKELANVVPFPGVAKLFAVIDRIVAITDTARYNREALPYMKEYMEEVKRTIKDHSDTINEEYTPSLMKTLENWEKFLAQYTQPKMKTLLTILNADEVNNNECLFFLISFSYIERQAEFSFLL